MKYDSRTSFEAGMDKINEVKRSESNGEVSDSKEVRMALMQRVHSGEITLEYAQSELKRIQREGKRQGKVTRSQAFSRG